MPCPWAVSAAHMDPEATLSALLGGWRWHPSRGRSRSRRGRVSSAKPSRHLETTLGTPFTGLHVLLDCSLARKPNVRLSGEGRLQTTRLVRTRHALGAASTRRGTGELGKAGSSVPGGVPLFTSAPSSPSCRPAPCNYLGCSALVYISRETAVSEEMR